MFGNSVEFPGRLPCFLWATLWDFLGQPPWKFKPPWLTCAEYGSRYGGLTLIWIAGRPYVVLNDGALVREVLETNAQQYYKADPVPALSPLTIPPDLFLTNDAEWQRLRTQHPYAKVEPQAWLADQLPIVRRLVRERTRSLASVSATGPIDLLPALQRLTFDVFARSLWGELLDDQTYRDFCTMGDVGSRRMTSPLVFLPPLSPRFYAARRRWTRTFAARLDAARRRPDPTQRDLLHLSLPQSQALSDDTYRVLLATMFYGGVYSVTSGIVTVLYHLSRYPDIAAEVRKELRSLVAGTRISTWPRWRVAVTWMACSASRYGCCRPSPFSCATSAGSRPRAWAATRFRRTRRSSLPLGRCTARQSIGRPPTSFGRHGG